MRLLADENIPLPSVDALRAAGHEVASITRESPGLADPRILERARAESRLILTFDRDFGELVFARGVSGHPGVIFLRFVPRTPGEPADVILALVTRMGLTFEGRFTVIDRDHVRQRTLPLEPAQPMQRKIDVPAVDPPAPMLFGRLKGVARIIGEITGPIDTEWNVLDEVHVNGRAIDPLKYVLPDDVVTN